MKRKQHLNKRTTQAGLTLVEVLASLVLVSVLLITFFSFFIQTNTFSNKNEEKLVAFHLATQTLSLLQSDYTRPANGKILSCTSYPEDLSQLLPSSSCYYQKNNKQYYPEITIRRQADVSSLYTLHVKIYNSDDLTKRQLLSETFGYIRGM